MINSFSLRNFGPILNLDWTKRGNITLLIGSNATGKTFLLKVLYSYIRSLEEHGKGNDPRKFEDVLAQKLYWTFQVDKLGQLVRKGASDRLEFSIETDEGKGNYSFGEKTSNTITNSNDPKAGRDVNSVFIPAKEVLSLLEVIRYSREQQKIFGFDDTYYDLAKALNISTQKGKNYTSFSKARTELESIIGGKLNFDDVSRSWVLKQGRYQYPINIASEGNRKIGVFDTLLGNRYLSPESVLFIDEPESALHPTAQSRFLEILSELSQQGMQIFIASHSYYVIKKLFLLAKSMSTDISVLSLTPDGISESNLKTGMPENQIIQESVNLYEQEVELSFS